MRSNRPDQPHVKRHCSNPAVDMVKITVKAANVQFQLEAKSNLKAAEFLGTVYNRLGFDINESYIDIAQLYVVSRNRLISTFNQLTEYSECGEIFSEHDTLLIVSYFYT